MNPKASLKDVKDPSFNQRQGKKAFQRHCIVSEGKMIGEKKFEILYELSQLVIEKIADLININMIWSSQ